MIHRFSSVANCFLAGMLVAASLILPLLSSTVRGVEATSVDDLVAVKKWRLEYRITIDARPKANYSRDNATYDGEHSYQRTLTGHIDLTDPMPFMLTRAGDDSNSTIPKPPLAPGSPLGISKDMISNLAKQQTWIWNSVASPNRGELSINDRLRIDTSGEYEAKSKESQSKRSTWLARCNPSLSGPFLFAIDTRARVYDLLFGFDIDNGLLASGGDSPDSKGIHHTMRGTETFYTAGFRKPPGTYDLNPIDEDLDNATFWNGTLAQFKGKNFPLTLQGDRLKGETVVEFSPTHHLSTGGQPPSAKSLTATLEWCLIPNPLPDLDLVIEIQGYDDWVPKAGKDESTPGPAPVLFNVQLLEPDGRLTTQPIKRFVLSLPNCSKEPGICMNWPAPRSEAKDDPDLQFEASDSIRLIGKFGQEAEVKDPNVARFDGTINCYDWGAYSELSVIAEMTDGRKIVGHLKTQKSGTAIFLPKRSASSKIADLWKKQHAATQLADDDDSENDPVGDGFKGDGFTLYEEYRGFLENDNAKPKANFAHFSTDPQKKDLLICNLTKTIEPVAHLGDLVRFGIEKYQTATQLVVHSNMVYITLDDRKVNFNVGEGPHRCDQHAVIIEAPSESSKREKSLDQAGEFGGGTFPEKAKDREDRGPFTPGKISKIVIRPLDAWSTADEMILGVAHELGHATHIQHHGEIDRRFVYWVGGNQLPAADIGGKTDAIYEVTFTDGASSNFDEAFHSPQRTGLQPIIVYEEGSKTPLSANDGRFSRPQRWYVASEGGQHSGPPCIMRYDLAMAYEKKATPNIRTIYFKGGTDPAIFCHSRLGPPPNRYGNASVLPTPVNKGCLDQLRVNDADH